MPFGRFGRRANPTHDLGGPVYESGFIRVLTASAATMRRLPSDKLSAGYRAQRIPLHRTWVGELNPSLEPFPESMTAHSWTGCCRLHQPAGILRSASREGGHNDFLEGESNPLSRCRSNDCFAPGPMGPRRDCHSTSHYPL